jgi:recombination endonuclease VII
MTGKGRFPHTPRLSDEVWNRIAKEQGERCAMCHQRKEYLLVDHDHDTGEIRGLICRSCNVRLGFMGDGIGALHLAYAYLRRARPNVESPAAEPRNVRAEAEPPLWPKRISPPMKNHPPEPEDWCARKYIR